LFLRYARPTRAHAAAKAQCEAMLAMISSM
jgi:hypothetical protein